MTNYPLTSDETMKLIEDWEFITAPNEDEDSGYYGWEKSQLDKVRKREQFGSIKDKHRIWSVIESDNCDCLYIVADQRWVNVIHYMVSNIPWTDPDTECCDYHCPKCQEKEEAE